MRHVPTRVFFRSPIIIGILSMFNHAVKNSIVMLLIISVSHLLLVNLVDTQPVSVPISNASNDAHDAARELYEFVMKSSPPEPYVPPEEVLPNSSAFSSSFSSADFTS